MPESTLLPKLRPVALKVLVHGDLQEPRSAASKAYQMETSHSEYSSPVPPPSYEGTPICTPNFKAPNLFGNRSIVKMHRSLSDPSVLKAARVRGPSKLRPNSTSNEFLDGFDTNSPVSTPAFTLVEGTAGGQAVVDMPKCTNTRASERQWGWFSLPAQALMLLKRCMSQQRVPAVASVGELLETEKMEANPMQLREKRNMLQLTTFLLILNIICFTAVYTSSSSGPLVNESRQVRWSDFLLTLTRKAALANGAVTSAEIWLDEDDSTSTEQHYLPKDMAYSGLLGRLPHGAWRKLLQKSIVPDQQIRESLKGDGSPARLD